MELSSILLKIPVTTWSLNRQIIYGFWVTWPKNSKVKFKTTRIRNKKKYCNIKSAAPNDNFKLSVEVRIYFLYHVCKTINKHYQISINKIMILRLVIFIFLFYDYCYYYYYKLREEPNFVRWNKAVFFF